MSGVWGCLSVCLCGCLSVLVCGGRVGVSSYLEEMGCTLQSPPRSTPSGSSPNGYRYIPPTCGAIADR